MNHHENRNPNMNFYNDKINMIDTNINLDSQDSDKSFSLEENPTCIPHLFEKIIYLKTEKTENNIEVIGDNNNKANNDKGKSSKKIEDESLNSKTIIIEKRNKCGRKRKGEKYNNDNKDAHNKFSDDNARRKVKRIIFTHLRKYINNQIKIKYNGNIGNGIYKKELYILNQEQTKNTSVTFNKELLGKTLRDIFSDKISSRITNFPDDHNKTIIEGLINEKDKEKRIYFQNLFNLTFSDCLDYLRGDKYFDQLKGLELFSEFKEIKQDFLKEYKDGEEYVELLKYYLQDYNKIINRKNPRESSKKKNKKDRKSVV